jgi:hypothetical protein
MRVMLSRSSSPPSTYNRAFIGTLLISCLLLWGMFVTKSSPPQPALSTGLVSARASTGSSIAKASPSATGVEEGRVGGIEYYRCSRTRSVGAAHRTGDASANAASSTSNKAKTLLLFHGAAFTRQNWKDSGILKLLCALESNDTPSDAHIKNDKAASTFTLLNVYAFDLPVSASAHDLKALLDAMQLQGMVSLPVHAVVTPSASGKMVVEWDPLRDASLPALSTYAALWMPIASPAVKSVQHPDQQFPRQFEKVTVVPVYGNQDEGGKRTMTLLAQHVPESDLVELAGRHPCYLDSPADFVRLLLDKLNVS